MLISLTIIAIVIVACVLCNKLTNKIGVPMLLAFILLGVIFGSDGIFKIPFDDFEFVEQVCTVALIFIMFYGGFGTNWKEAKPVAHCCHHKTWRPDICTGGRYQDTGGRYSSNH